MTLLERALWFLSITSILPPFIYSLGLLRKSRGRLIRQIFWFSAFIALIEAAGYISAYQKTNNLWVSHVYIPVEYALLASMYYFAFESARVKRSIVVSVVVFFMFSVLNVIYLESPTHYNSYPRTLESICMVLLAMGYFYQVFQDVRNGELEKDSYFLLSVGVLFCFAGSSVINSLFNVMVSYSNEYAMLGMKVLFVLNILFNYTLVMVLWRAPRA